MKKDKELEAAIKAITDTVKTTISKDGDGRTKVRSEGHDERSYISEALKQHVLDECKAEMVVIFAVNRDGVSVASLSVPGGVNENLLLNLAASEAKMALFHKDMVGKVIAANEKSA